MKPWLCPSSSLYPTTAGKSGLALFFPFNPTCYHHSTGTSLVRSPDPFHMHLALRSVALKSPCGLFCTTKALLCCTGIPGAVSRGEFHFPSQVLAYIWPPQLEWGGNSKHSNYLHIGPSARLGLHLLSVTSVRGCKALGAPAVAQVADVMAEHRLLPPRLLCLNVRYFPKFIP